MTEFAPGIAARAIVVTLIAAWLAGCATSDENAARLFVAPGKYELYDCAQLDRQAGILATREAELSKLMDKAKQGAGGGLVSALTYDTEFYSARAELVEIRKTQAAKSCPAPSKR